MRRQSQTPIRLWKDVRYLRITETTNAFAEEIVCAGVKSESIPPFQKIYSTSIGRQERQHLTDMALENINIRDTLLLELRSKKSSSVRPCRPVNSKNPISKELLSISRISTGVPISNAREILRLYRIHGIELRG